MSALTRWGRRLVADLLPGGVSAGTRQWADSYGTDLRAAWAECEDPLVLRILAYGLGVPGTIIRAAWEAEFGEPRAPNPEELRHLPAWDVWQRALFDPKARATVDACLAVSPARSCPDQIAHWKRRGCRAYRAAIKLDEYLIFEDTHH